MVRKLIVGISGPSTSGKSTIAKRLSEIYKAKIFCLDEYFSFSEKGIQVFHETQIFNYDIVESIDWNLFYNDIIKYYNNNDFDIIIIEGFLLVGDERISKITDIVINIEFNDCDFNLALERRIKRGFNEDVPKDYHENPTIDKIHFSCIYFEEIVWSEMKKHPEYRIPREWKKPCLKLNATDDLDNNIKISTKFVNDCIVKTSCVIY